MSPVTFTSENGLIHCKIVNKTDYYSTSFYFKKSSLINCFFGIICEIYYQFLSENYTINTHTHTKRHVQFNVFHADSLKLLERFTNN